ncbi:photosystem I reaction center subunit PsaK [Lusitaniella coriacea LEGE 07157]|uniref:Photosystem I reaction center subunit PsaK n=1 Tax=Lusitaniella coriacea LEGE 07157 TaxID=945747 RepID=A0A8J7DZW2_9CYAN|nr:photosystem I reaction center subunit PsaK [Lusitaniella coriacea]MBE9117871.1 photosystem I reaction center subunit PsaK [Lusitaniella coriacea LEGE 07157]
MISQISAVLSTVPATTEWNLSVAIVMIACNLFAVAIGRFAIKNPGKSPGISGAKPALWEKFGLAELLATLSFGHILGAGMILGLSNAGLL